MNHKDVRSSGIEAEISSAIARKVLHLLQAIPRTEWRHQIIPFPAIYKKAGYVMKLDRKTTQNVLRLLARQERILIVNFHGVMLPETVSS